MASASEMCVILLICLAILIKPFHNTKIIILKYNNIYFPVDLMDNMLLKCMFKPLYKNRNCACLLRW